MNLPLRYNIAQNTQYYVTPKSLSPSIGKKKGTALAGNARSENDLYSSISGVVVFVSRWMLFVSFLRHSPSLFPEGNLV